MTTLQTINASASPEVQVNENFIATSPAGIFGRKSTTTAALTWGYYGGIFPGTYAVIADGTKALTDNATNYIECDSAGVVYTNTSAFTAGRQRLYSVVCAGGAQTCYTDYRTVIGINVPVLTGDNTWTGQNTFAAGTITTSKPLALTQTWNAGGVTFDALTVAISDTASAAGSRLLRLLSGASGTTEKFSVDKSGNVAIAGDATVSGSLTVNGTVTTVNTANLAVTDSLIKLATGNAANTLDIGTYGVYQPAATPLYTGLFRDASDGIWKLFDGLQSEPTTTVNIGGTGYAAATLLVDALQATTLTGTLSTAAQPNVTSLGTLTGLSTGLITNSVASGYAATFMGGNVGIGTTAPNAKLESLATTEQLRTSYDATHYASFTTNSTGNLTIAPVGGTLTVTGALSATGAITANGNFTAKAGTAQSIGYAGSEYIRIDSNGMAFYITNPYPAVDNSISWGITGQRWSAIWAANGTIQTSDRNKKTNIVDSDLGLDFILALKPVLFEPTDELGEPRYGLIAQDVLVASKGRSMRGFIIGEEGSYGMNYAALVTPLVSSVQYHEFRLRALEANLK